MDPRECIRYWMDFTSSGDGAYARRAASNYADWIGKGGHPARVELSPATDAWMMGDRFGKVVKCGRKYLYVLMDRSCRTLRVSPGNIFKVY